MPAPPPIDAEAYAKAGLQFYAVEERPDDRLEGGDFGDVKSVAAMDKQKLQMEEKPLDPTVLAECRCGKRLCDCVYVPMSLLQSVPIANVALGFGRATIRSVTCA